MEEHEFFNLALNDPTHGIFLLYSLFPSSGHQIKPQRSPVPGGLCPFGKWQQYLRFTFIKNLCIVVDARPSHWGLSSLEFSVPLTGGTALGRTCILIVKPEAGKAVQELFALEEAQQMMNSRPESYHVFQDDVRDCWKLPLTNVHGKGNYLQQWKMFLLCDPKKDQDPYHWENDHPPIPY